MAISLAFVKEIFSLQAAFCGIFLILSRKKWTAGILLFSFGIVYFYFAAHYFQRYFSIAPLMDHLLLDLSSASLTLKESSTSTHFSKFRTHSNTSEHILVNPIAFEYIRKNKNKHIRANSNTPDTARANPISFEQVPTNSGKFRQIQVFGSNSGQIRNRRFGCCMGLPSKARCGSSEETCRARWPRSFP